MMQNEAISSTGDSEAKERLRAIGRRLVSLQVLFSKNVLDATGAWSKDVDGRQLTLDAHAVDGVMRHAEDRELRRQVYEAYTTRASDRGPLAGRFDNGPVIDEILGLRHERATFLGFRGHADALAGNHPVASADDAERLLLELNARVRPSAQAELEEIWKIAKSQDGIKGFRPWDLAYYAERLAGARPGFTPAALGKIREIEVALFDLRLHRDYVPAERASKLRSHVLDTFAQARREVSVLPPPPWDRTACGLVEIFGDGEAGGDHYAHVVTRAPP
jgi:Zn-dependent oligopeptidase